MTQTSNMRFAHFQEEWKFYSGMTVAYCRTETNVFFAYSLCAAGDQYNKSIGRALTTQNYEKRIDEIHHDFSYVDTTKRIGCLSIADYREVLRNTQITKLLADHVVDSLSMMDIKHSAIQTALIQCILLKM